MLLQSGLGCKKVGNHCNRGVNESSEQGTLKTESKVLTANRMLIDTVKPTIRGTDPARSSRPGSTYWEKEVPLG